MHCPSCRHQVTAGVTVCPTCGAAVTPPALESFVIVHDQDLLLAHEAQGHYRHLPNARFIFVGEGPTSNLAGREDLVVARDLERNIEERHHLLAFTAWFAVAKNRLGSAPFLALLEYDVEATADFTSSTLSALEASPGDLVGYLPVPLSDPRFAHTNAPFASALLEAHGIDVRAVVARHLDSTGSDLWTATSNLALSSDALDAFVDWYLPVAEVLGDDPLGGHVHERSLAIFGALEGRGTSCLRGVLTHSQEASHGVGIELHREERTGTRRLAPRDSDPELSIVVVAHRDGDRLLDTLRTLTPGYQVGVPAGSYEVIVVDDASWPALDRETILAVGDHVRHLHRGSSEPNPVRAIELGVEMARGERLALFPNAAEPAGPRLLLWASRTFDLFEDSLTRVAVRGPSGSGAGGASAVLCGRRRFIQLGGFAGVAKAGSAVALQAPVAIELWGESTVHKVPGAEATPDARERELDRLAAELSGQSRRLEAAIDRIDRLKVALAKSQATSRHLAERAEERAGRLAALRSLLTEREERLAQVLSSHSWRLTAPLRRLLGRLRAHPQGSQHRTGKTGRAPGG